MIIQSHRPEAQCWGLDLFIDSLQCPTGDVCFILHREQSTWHNIKTSKMAQFTPRDGGGLTNQ